MKVKFNQKLLSIFNYIETCEYSISFADILHWSIDMDCYKELYINLRIVENLLYEHNSAIPQEISSIPSSSGESN